MTSRQEPVAEFCAALAELRRVSGPDVLTLAQELHISKTQLYSILNGEIKRPPDWEKIVRPLVAACAGGDPATVARWRQRHGVLVTVWEELGRRDRSAVTPAPPKPGPSPGTVVPRQLPAATRHFAGRLDELGKLTRLAADAAGPKAELVILAIDGTAGVGKTTLAVHFARQVGHQFPDGQLYVNMRGFDKAGQPMAPDEAMRIFLEALAVPADRIPAGLDAQAGLWRSLLVGRRMLILLDNAGDVDQVRPLIPAAPGCLVIVTSRCQLVSLVTTEGAFPLTLDILTDADARELIISHLGTDAAASDRAAVNELIRLCAGLPLALSVGAARAASQPGFPLAFLTAELRDVARRLDVLDGGDPAASVRAVFSWSYRQLDEGTARVFRMLGLHPGTGAGIRVEAAASMSGLPVREARRALGELTRARLLAPAESGRLTFHDLLRAYATERAEAEDTPDERREAFGRMLDHYLHTAYNATVTIHPTRPRITLEAARPGTVPEQFGEASQALAWYEAERLALLAVTAAALDAGFDRHAGQIVWAMNRFLDLRGYWHDQAAAGQIAITAAERLGDLAAQAEAHRTYGMACGHLGWHARAYQHLGQALSRYVETGDRVGEAVIHGSLAITLANEDRHQEAYDEARKSLDLYTELGLESGRASALNHVGWILAKLGDYDEALRCCHQALELLARLGNRQMEAATLDTTGYAHYHLGHHAEAVDYFQRSLALNRELGDRLGMAEVLSHLGDARRAAGRLAEARAAWEESLTVLAELHRSDAWQVRAKLSELNIQTETHQLGLRATSDPTSHSAKSEAL